MLRLSLIDILHCWTIVFLYGPVCLFVCLFAVLNSFSVFFHVAHRKVLVFLSSFFESTLCHIYKKKMPALFYYFAFAKWMMASHHTNVWISDEQFPTEFHCLFFLLWVTRNNHLFSYDSLCRFFLVCLWTEYQDRKDPFIHV